MVGKLLKWSEVHGFGFIECEDHSVFFLHYSNITSRPKRIQGTPFVSFTSQAAPGKRNPLAVNAVVGVDKHGLLLKDTDTDVEVSGRAQ